MRQNTNKVALALCALMLSMTLANSISAQLVDPLSEVNSSTPVAVGVASYGLYNISQGTGPYRIQTGEVVGYTRIDSLYAYNATPPANVSQYGATVQLNVVMNVTGRNGQRYSYWIQDVMDLNTSNRTYFLIDNIWNLTSSNANLTNATVYGNGNFSYASYPVSFFLNGTQEFYGDSLNTTPYSYPLFFDPVIKVDLFAGRPVVHIGYDQNGTDYFYDNVTFNIPASSAYILVTPYYISPVSYFSNYNGSFYDAEMVIGGEAGGEISSFSNANATLWIGYLNGTKLVPFPVVGDFGINTDESATNLAAYEEANGEVIVTQGMLNYNQSIRLGPAPASLFTSSPNESSSTTTIQRVNASSPTTSSTTYVTTVTTAPTTSMSSGNSTSAGGGSNSRSQQLYEEYNLIAQILLIVVLILAVVLYLIIRAIHRANVSG